MIIVFLLVAFGIFAFCVELRRNWRRRRAEDKVVDTILRNKK